MILHLAVTLKMDTLVMGDLSLLIITITPLEIRDMDPQTIQEWEAQVLHSLVLKATLLGSGQGLPEALKEGPLVATHQAQGPLAQALVTLLRAHHGQDKALPPLPLAPIQALVLHLAQAPTCTLGAQGLALTLGVAPQLPQGGLATHHDLATPLTPAPAQGLLPQHQEDPLHTLPPLRATGAQNPTRRRSEGLVAQILPMGAPQAPIMGPTWAPG